MLQEHLGYVSDSARLERYTEAIRRVIKSGDRVLDLGCGTGVLGLLCLRLGAGRVFAVDATAAIELARQTLSQAGLGDRAVFVRGESRRVALPERVDLVVCDQVGYFGFDAGILADMSDARRRFLKPAGALIPSVISLHVAGVESELAYAPVAGWTSEPVPEELRWVRDRAVNARYPVSVNASMLVTEPGPLGSIDLREDPDSLYSWTARLSARREATLHGIAGWFDCELAPGVSMTNSPLADRPINRPQAFFPLEEPARIRTGEPITVTIVTRPDEDVIVWVVELPSGRRLKHSTWNSMPLDSADVHRANPERIPRPNRMAEARATILGYCDGRLTARDIERAVLRDHPDLFPSPREISRVVTQVLAKDAAEWLD